MDLSDQRFWLHWFSRGVGSAFVASQDARFQMIG